MSESVPKSSKRTSGDVGNLDHIADLERPLEEQDDAADEILEDRLGAETDTDGERAAEKGEGGEPRSWRRPIFSASRRFCAAVFAP